MYPADGQDAEQLIGAAAQALYAGKALAPSDCMVYSCVGLVEERTTTMSRISISAGSVTMAGELNASETAKKVLEALPLKGSARTWGDEVYLDTQLSLPEEDPQAHVPPGVIAYWPQGKAICLFFGQTPASPVNVIGKMLGNPRDFAAVSPGDTVRIAPAPQD